MTQEKIIEKHLLEHKTISTYQAFKDYGITCLNKMIQLLRKKYLIKSNWVKVNNKRFVIYELVINQTTTDIICDTCGATIKAGSYFNKKNIPNKNVFYLPLEKSNFIIREYIKPLKVK